MTLRFPTRKMFKTMLRGLLDRPVSVILVILSVTVFFALHLPDLTFNTSIYDFVIEDLPEKARYEDFKKVFGDDEIIRVVVKGKNVFDPVFYEKIESLSEALGKIQGVNRIISLPGIKKAVDLGGDWSLKKFSRIITPVRLFQRNIISEDHKSTAITLVLASGAKTEQVIQDVERLMARMPKNLSIYQIGMPLVSRALARLTERDFFKLPLITFFIISLVLFFLLRNPVPVFLSLTCVGLALIWTLGLMGLTQTPLTMLTMIVPVFIIAVGTAYCLYLCSEYLDRLKESETVKDAVYDSFSRMILPMALVVLTTLIGIGSLLVNRIVSIHEFAVFSGAGIISLFIVLVTFLPVVLYLCPWVKNRPVGFKKINGWIDGLLNRIILINLNHQKTSLVGLGVVFVFCLAGIYQLRSDTNPIGYFKDDTQVSRNFHDIYKDLSGSFPINVSMNSNIEYYFEDPKHMLEIAKLQDFIQTLPGIDKTISFADYLKLVNYAMNQFEAKFYVLPEEDFEVRMLINNFKTLLGEDMLSRFMNQDFSRANILLLTHISSSGEFLQTQDKILAHVREHYSKQFLWDVTGFGMVVSASSQALVDGQVKSIALTLVIISGIMVLLFFSAKVGLIALIPALFPIVVNFGLMGWMGIKLSVATSLIACIAIGLAIDDIVHYLVRYSREFKRDLDKDRALHDTIKSVGRPIIFTTLTISLGFSILILSGFKPTSVFGFLMVVTMMSALIGDLIVLPTLMLHVELVTAWDFIKLMPTLGGMSAGIAHELNQPLTVIKMGNEIMKKSIQDDIPLQEGQLARVVKEIDDQVNRASAIINRLSNFEAKPDFEKEMVNMNRVIRDCLAIMNHQLNLENIKLKLDLEPNLPPVLAHPNRMGQVYVNLIKNAIEAINEIKQTDSATGLHFIGIRTFAENNHIKVTVSDSGIGMPEQLQERVCEPFFTTKEKGQGKGLGLCISDQIVKSFDGTLEVDSLEGKGTTVLLSFPCHVD